MSMILAQISRLDTFVFSAFIQGRLLEAANVDINSVACELQARMLRFNNVDFYNVPEGHASNIPDDTQVRDLLFLVPSTSNSTPVAFKRIDNSGGPNRPPLLLETLQSLDRRWTRKLSRIQNESAKTIPQKKDWRKLSRKSKTWRKLSRKSKS